MQLKKFGDNSPSTLAYLFLLSGSSESPTPASAEGASCPGGGVDGWVVIKSVLQFYLFLSTVMKAEIRQTKGLNPGVESYLVS